MNLIQKPETVTWPDTHYVFIEKIGPFKETAPAAWQHVHRLAPKISEHNQITGYMSLYKIEPSRMTYRAGVALAAVPTKLPDGFESIEFGGGKYACFVLTGTYANLPQACGRVFEIISEKQIPRRDDFCIEHYVNDPRTTPEEQLITEILIPTL